MPYITKSELDQPTSHISFDANTPPAENQSLAYDIIFATPNRSKEQRNLIYAYWNLQKYKETLDTTYFKEARKYFEKITNPFFNNPQPNVDFRNQAHLYLGELWETAHRLAHNELSHLERCDPRQCAVRHYQQVTLKPVNGAAPSPSDGTMVIAAHQRILALYLGNEQDFPHSQDDIARPGIFKADHLKCIIAAIEIRAMQNRFHNAFPHQADFPDFATVENINAYLTRYLNIFELQNKHLVFLEGDGTLTQAQRYKIARTCFDRGLITAENFHAILRHIHHKIKTSVVPDDQQLRRNVKYYLASVSLRLYYQINQTPTKKAQYLNDLTGIYNDLIGTKKELYREAIANRKPKALEAQRLMARLIIAGDQKIPYSDPLTHGIEITSPLMKFFSTVVAVPFIILGFLVDFMPRMLFSIGAILLQVVSFPVLLFLAIFCCRCSGKSGLEMLVVPLVLLTVIFQPWASRDNGVGFWGQTIHNRWLDTGFTFVLGKLGNFLGNAIGFAVGFVLSVALYIPRLIIQGLRNLVRTDSEQATPAQIKTALQEDRLALEIEKAPLDYLRQNKQYSNYQNDAHHHGAHGNFQDLAVRKYSQRFRLFPLNDEQGPGRAYYNAPQRYDHAGSQANAPSLQAIGIYDQYVGSAPPFEPSNAYDNEASSVLVHNSN